MKPPGIKKPDPKRLLKKMPDGEELYAVAREILKSAAEQHVRSWYPDLLPKKKDLGPLDPFLAAHEMAARFIPYIRAYLDRGGKIVRAEMGLQSADDWLVEAPEVIEAANAAVLDLCQETIDKFLSDLNTSLEGIRADVAESIQSGETLEDTVNRVSTWIKDNSRWRARRIAVTESARAYNAGQHAAVQKFDFVIGFELLLSDDACPLCHAIKRLCPVIPKNGNFGENGKNDTYKELQFPPLHPGCRCTTVPLFEDEAPQQWPSPVKPGANGYIRPSEADYAAAEAGGYESVAIGNAKSVKCLITATEAANEPV